MSVADDVHGLIDKSASAATMIAFCAPEAGPLIAAAIASTHSIMDVIFMFAGDTDTAPAFVTESELNAAIGRIPKMLDDASRETDVRHHFQRIAHFNDVMAKHWKDSDPTYNPGFIGAFARKTQTTEWQTQMDKLAEPLDENAQDGILSHLGDLKLTVAENSVSALHIYVYGVTTFLLLVKINVTWEYSKIFRDHQVALGVWKQHKSDADDAISAWKMHIGKKGPRPKTPAPLQNLLSKDEIARSSPYIRLLKAWLPDMISYVRAQHDTIKGYFDTAESEYKTYERKVSQVHQFGAQDFGFVDYGKMTAGKPYVKAGIPTPYAATIARAAYLGQIQTALFHQHVTANNADIYTPKLLKKLEAICDEWDQANTDAVAFLKTYDGKNTTITP